MTQQYLRACSLIVGNASGEGIDLSELHIKFTVNRADTSTPSWADIRIYNLSTETAKQIQQEFTHVFLQAGYEGNLGLIFSGQIRQKRQGRENGTDTFLNIIAQDGDEGYNFSVMNTTLAAGWTQNDLHGAALQAFAPFDITAGYKPLFGGPAMPRARVCYGMTRDFMQTLADSAGSSWSITDGALSLIPTAAVLPGEAVVLSAKSGMIGLPQQTISGIVVKCLLNPKIKFGGQVQIDNASIQEADISVQYSAINFFPSLDNDGFYKVYSITMTGDTRGQDWYSSLICAAVDGTSPLSGPYVNATASGTGY